MTLSLEVLGADSLDASARDEIRALCSRAYEEDFAQLFVQLPLSTHVLARDESGALVSHAAWVVRMLEPSGLGRLTTAYVEAVASDPSMQGRGIGSAVMRRLLSAVIEKDYEFAALSPSDPAFYFRLGWELWKGPLGIRTSRGIEASPLDEQVMIYRLPSTPPSLDVNGSLTAEWRAFDLW